MVYRTAPFSMTLNDHKPGQPILWSSKLVPFKSLGTASYSLSIVTMVVSVAVCEIFSINEWCDLENRVRVRSSSLEMAQFDRSRYFLFAFYSNYGDILYRLRDIATYW